MDTLQCAIVLAKLERFEWEVNQRIENGDRYNTLMDGLGVERVRLAVERTSMYAQYTVLVEQRERLQELLKNAGIPTAVHYPVPLNEQPAYSKYGSALDTPISSAVSKRVMSLPMSADVGEAIDHVASQLSEVLSRLETDIASAVG